MCPFDKPPSDHEIAFNWCLKIIFSFSIMHDGHLPNPARWWRVMVVTVMVMVVMVVMMVIIVAIVNGDEVDDGGENGHLPNPSRWWMASQELPWNVDTWMIQRCLHLPTQLIVGLGMELKRRPVLVFLQPIYMRVPVPFVCRLVCLQTLVLTRLKMFILKIGSSWASEGRWGGK